MPRFTLFRGGKLERSFQLVSDDIRIGRLQGLEITLETRSVSREHAHIRRDASGFMLVDAGSVNGVLVRGKRVTDHRLVAGDSIGIEDYTLVFEPPDDIYESGAPAPSEEPHPGRATDPNMTFLNIARFLPPRE